MVAFCLYGAEVQDIKALPGARQEPRASSPAWDGPVGTAARVWCLGQRLFTFHSLQPPHMAVFQSLLGDGGSYPEPGN